MMRHVPVVFLLILSGTLLAQNRAPVLAAPDIQALIPFVQQFLKARQSSNIAALSALTTEDYLEVLPSGQTLTRAMLLNPQNSGNSPGNLEVTIRLPQLRVFGRQGVVTAIVQYREIGFLAQPHTTPCRAIWVAQATPAGWKLLSTSYARLAPARPRWQLP